MYSYCLLGEYVYVEFAAKVLFAVVNVVFAKLFAQRTDRNSW